MMVPHSPKQIYLTIGGMFSVAVIIIGSGIKDPSTNSWWGCSHFTFTLMPLGKGMNTSVLSPATGK